MDDDETFVKFSFLPTYDIYLQYKKTNLTKSGFYAALPTLLKQCEDDNSSKPTDSSSKPLKKPQNLPKSSQNTSPKQKQTKNDRYCTLNLDQINFYHEQYRKYFDKSRSMDDIVNTMNIKSLPAEDKANFKKFKQLHTQVREEQEKYRNWSEQQARFRRSSGVRGSSGFAGAGDMFSIDIKDYVDDLVKMENSRIHLYPRYWIFRQEIFFASEITGANLPIAFKKIKVVKNQGPTLLVTLPPINKLPYPSLKKGTEKLSQRYPPEEYTKPDCHPWKKTIISCDPVAHQLANEHSVNIVTCPAALVVLLNHSRDVWEIPIKIVEQNGRKIAYLDKPFLPRIVTPRQRHAMLFKMSATHHLVHRAPSQNTNKSLSQVKQEPTYSPPNKMQKFEPQTDVEEEKLPSSQRTKHNLKNIPLCVKQQESAMNNTIDKPNDDDPMPKRVTRSQHKRVEEQASNPTSLNSTKQLSNQSPSDSEDDDNNLVIDTGLKSPPCAPKLESMSVIIHEKQCRSEDVCEIEEPAEPDEEQIATDAPKVIPLDSDESYLLRQPTPQHESSEIGDYELSPRKDVFTRHSPTKTAPVDDSTVDDLAPPSLQMASSTSSNEHSLSYSLWQCGLHSLLIRHRQHGLARFNKHDARDEVYLQVKLEYQQFKGCEVLTWNEMWKAWLGSQIRDNATILRIRSSPADGNILLYEREKLEDLLKQYSAFQPQRSLPFLNKVFNLLSGLPSGQYLLSRKMEEPLCRLYEAPPCQLKRSPGSIDIRHEHLNVTDETPNHVEWLPLDTRLFTVHQLATKTVPGIFDLLPVSVKGELTEVKSEPFPDTSDSRRQQPFKKQWRRGHKQKRKH